MSEQACTQPGCTGTYAEDGYCTVCGAPAPAEAASGAADADSASSGSARLESAALGSSRVGTESTRRAGGSQRLRSSRLGQGVTTVPVAAELDPSEAVLENPVVPENRRHCPKCGEPVGRGIDGNPGRVRGFCPHCRHPFNFEPKLQPGELVAGQYEVVGCLAHGGLGWIYLAKDRNVSDRWVVLKGLLNSADPDAVAAAIAEQRFLAQVSHPNIVEIYNFVTVGDAGYIVMEYVGGKSLKSILQERMKANHGVYTPLPVDQALAYVLEVMPAFTYLHDKGLLFCDFKPDNLIQVGDEVKLIDLGGVRRIDDDDSAIFGTVGYQAPEVARLGTSIASDVFTLGRTLMVLTTEFRGYQTKYAASFPPASEVPVFQRYDAFHRLLLKACAPARDDRFASADEMRVQMLGVLRDVVAIDQKVTAATASHSSVYFEVPGLATEEIDPDTLPALRPDPHDPQAGWLQTVSMGRPADRLAALQNAPERTAEVLVELARTALALDQLKLANSTADQLLELDPWDWRAPWIQGLAALQAGDGATARGCFNAVYGQIPGEVAPKLALANACESSGESELAERLYLACARGDASYVPTAAFGLYRIRGAREDIGGAAQALGLIATSSSTYPLAVRALSAMFATRPRNVTDLLTALELTDTTDWDPLQRAQVRTRTFRRALSGGVQNAEAKARFGGYPLTTKGLRSGLEEALRQEARLTTERGRRETLVDEANQVRPWSWT